MQLRLSMVGDYAVLYQESWPDRAADILPEQQKNLGAVNGYIEEMMNGQKVVKVFCHEEESIEEVPRS